MRGGALNKRIPHMRSVLVRRRKMDRFVVKQQKRARNGWPKKPAVLELFAGAGGMATGLEQAGFEHVALVEKDPLCVETLRRNRFKHVVHCDAKVVDFKQYRGADVVAGGPPCQPFSPGGLRRGEQDSRDGWPIAIRAVSDIQPRGFLFENVSGMLCARFNEYVTWLKEQFAKLGYSVCVHDVDAADYGAPQHRHRAFVVGLRDLAPFLPPRTVDSRLTVRDVMCALGPPNGDEDHKLHNFSARVYAGHTGSTMDKPSKCIVAGCQGPGGGMLTITLDDGTLRYFTHRELSCIQTFPECYKLPKVRSHFVKQVGNACPPLLARIFGEALLRQLPK